MIHHIIKDSKLSECQEASTAGSASLPNDECETEATDLIYQHTVINGVLSFEFYTNVVHFARNILWKISLENSVESQIYVFAIKYILN